jgi:putative oxidoreductase
MRLTAGRPGHTSARPRRAASRGASEMSDVVIAIGRVLLAVVFIVYGIGHIARMDAHLGFLSTGLTAHRLDALVQPQTLQIIGWAWAVIELAGGLMVGLGWGARIGAFLLIALTALQTWLFYEFWAPGNANRIADLEIALRNISLCGGLLMILGAGAGPYSIGPNGALGYRRDTVSFTETARRY